MRSYKHNYPMWEHYLNLFLLSLLFIGSDLLLLARDWGYLDPDLFRLIKKHL